MSWKNSYLTSLCTTQLVDEISRRADAEGIGPLFWDLAGKEETGICSLVQSKIWAMPIKDAPMSPDPHSQLQRRQIGKYYYHIL